MSGDFRIVALFLVALGLACAPGEDEPEVFAFVRPVPDTVVVRNVLNDAGEVVAPMHVALTVPSAVQRVELWLEAIGGSELLDTLGPGELERDVEIPRDGAVRLRAIAFDENDGELDDVEVGVLVEPGADTCTGWLDLYQLDYFAGPDAPGVADPVTVSVPINGLDYRYLGAQDPRSTMFMDCEMGLALASAAPTLRDRGIVEVWDIGIYNYRCIGSGTPPDCPNGMSQHAYALAVDLAAFVSADATVYSVNDDWVIDPDGEPTCNAVTEGPKDAFLHEMACDLKADFFNIVLTPNYNADHRNHFHVDLTPGADFIELDQRAVDEGPDLH